MLSLSLYLSELNIVCYYTFAVHISYLFITFYPRGGSPISFIGTQKLNHQLKIIFVFDVLTQVEKKVDGIRSAVQITTKKLSGTILGAGSTLEKHQVSIRYSILYHKPCL